MSLSRKLTIQGHTIYTYMHSQCPAQYSKPTARDFVDDKIKCFKIKWHGVFISDLVL